MCRCATYSSRVQNMRGCIQNIPDWCCHLYSGCGSEKHRFQQTKLWIPGSTAKVWGDCVKTCEGVAPNFDENRPGCFTMTTPRLTLPSSSSSFWRNTKWLSSPTHRTPWFGTLWLLPISRIETEAERTPVWYHWGDPGRMVRVLDTLAFQKWRWRRDRCLHAGRNYLEVDGGR
jgi:hypothetical protein